MFVGTEKIGHLDTNLSVYDKFTHCFIENKIDF